jgi:hypothetical protein
MILSVELNRSNSLAKPDIPEFSTDLAKNAYTYLVNVCEPDGIPNPRTLCTDGYRRAVEYVANEMENIGLEPLGDAGSFIQTIPESVNEDLCPPGIQNVIGMVRGSKYPDQYVVVLSTLSGNYNLNPQTYKTRGNDNFSFVFDSGMPVAASLAMAKEMIEREPPLRSTVFLFAGTGQSDGWQVVGERERGQKYGPYDSFMKTQWFRKMCDQIVSGSLECENIWMKGLTYWIKHPTVDLDQINIIFYADRLGSPYGFKENVLLLLGGEQTRYGTGNRTLNHFIDEVWPTNSSVQLLKAPLVAIDGEYFGYYARSNYFTEPCAHGEICNGLNLAWIAQMGFQTMGDKVDNIRNLYSELRKFSNNTLLPNDTFASLVFFTNDNLNNTYWPHFEPTVTALYDVVSNTANKEENIALSFDDSRGLTFDEYDFGSLFKSLDIMSALSQNLPSSLDFLFVNEYPDYIRGYAEVLMDGVYNGTIDLTMDFLQKTLRDIAQKVAGLFISMDYFNDKYPNSEAYLDQSIGSDLTTQPEPDISSSSPDRIESWATILLIVIATVACNIIVLAAVLYVAKRSKKHRTTNLEMVHVHRDTTHSETAADEEVASNLPVPASVMGIETEPYGSVPLSSIPVAVLFDSNSLAHSHTTVSIIPSPLAEEMDDSFAGNQIENRGSRVGSYGANDSKTASQTFMISQERKGQVEFKDQVLSDQRAPSVVVAGSLPSPRVEQSIKFGGQSEPVASPNHDDEGADSLVAGGALAGEQSQPQDEGSASDLQSRRASTGRPQHDIHVCGDPTTPIAESLTRSEEVDPVCPISSLVNQQLESSDDFSDSESESFATRLRFYSI